MELRVVANAIALISYSVVWAAVRVHSNGLFSKGYWENVLRLGNIAI